MKKLWHVIALLLLMLISQMAVYATPTPVLQANAFHAQKMPNGAQFYASSRTDEAFIDRLDEIFVRIVQNFSQYLVVAPDAEFIGNMNLRQALDSFSRQFGGDFESTLRPWLGDSIAVGLYWGEERLENILIIADHVGREPMRNFLVNTLPSTLTLETVGNLSIYSTISQEIFFAYDDDAFYFTAQRDFLPLNGTPSESLATSTRFQQALNALPANRYNILVVGETGAIAQVLSDNRPQVRQDIEMRLPNTYTAIGATILDEVSPTIDVVQIGLPAPLLSLFDESPTPTFLGAIPQNATGMIQGRNLLPLYQFALGIAAANGQDVQAQLAQAQAIFGMDVPALLFSGDVATYFRYKPEGYQRQLQAQLDALDNDVAYSFSVMDMFDAGIVFEVTNPTQAQTFITQLAFAYRLMGNTNVEMLQIGEHTALQLTIGTDNLGDLQVIVGTNESVIVIGTSDSAIAILNGEGGFLDNVTYQNSLRHSLPNRNYYAFLDRTSMVAMVDMARLLLVPSINQVFDSLMENLSSPSSTLTPQQLEQREAQRREIYRQSIMRMMQEQAGSFAFAELFDSASISVNSKETVLFIRMVITLSE